MATYRTAASRRNSIWFDSNRQSDASTTVRRQSAAGANDGSDLSGNEMKAAMGTQTDLVTAASHG